MGVDAEHRGLVGVRRLGSTANLLRVRKEGEHARVTFVELFYDLVFVFAVTQLSHGLVEHMTLLGALEIGLLFLAMWWVWVDTCWVANWLDPERIPVRALLMVLMLAGLAMSISIPQAFGERGLVFALAIAFTQVGRGIFMLWALRRHHHGNFVNFVRITAWLATAAVFWICGGLAEEGGRLTFWIVALAIECAAPALGFWLPGLGRSTTKDWDIDGAHMAERCGLFIIIALGESILVTGARFSALTLNGLSVAAFLACFLGSVTMWWIYFDITADKASHRIAQDRNPGRLARLAYTYFHIPIVAGIIVTAVADELVLEHPNDKVTLAYALVTIGGPALFLLGNILFKRATAGRIPRSHLLGLALLVACTGASGLMTTLELTAATTATLVIVAFVETIGLRRAMAATVT